MTARGWLAALCLALATLGGRAPDARATPGTVSDTTDTSLDPDRYLEVLVELRFGRLLARTIAAYQVDDIALLPLTDFLRMADYRQHASGDSLVTAVLQPGDVEVRFVLGATAVAVGDRSVRVRPDDLISRDGVMYMATGPLGEVLDVSFIISWRDLSVAIEDPAPLPVAQTIYRAARRRAVARSQRTIQPDLTLAAPRTGFGGFVLNYSALLPEDDPVNNGTFALGVGANLLGGSLELTTRTVGSASSGRSAQVRGSWTGFWPEDRWLRQVRVGDAISTGPRGRAIRGLSITNVPFWRPPSFGFANFRGTLGPGWEIEAYRSGELVAYDTVTAAGQWAFDLPVERGQNATEFIAYGPYGEIRRFNRTFQIGQLLLPRRHFEYGVSAGACTSSLCDGTLNADFRYGLTQRITVAGGFDRYWRTQNGSLNHPYAAIGGSIINAVTLELGAVYDGFARAALRVEPSINTRFLVEHLDYDDNVTDPIITPQDARSRTTVNAFYRPGRWDRYLFFEAQADRVITTQGRTSRGRLAMSAALMNVTVSPFVRVLHEERGGFGTTRTFGGLELVTLPQRRWGSIFGSLSFRAGIQLEEFNRINRADVFVFKSFPRAGIRIEAGADWVESLPGVNYRLGVTSTMGGVFASLRSLFTGSGSSQTFAQLQGSAAWNPEHRNFTLSPVGTFQQSGITGTVFLDHNVNGVRDPGEPGVPGARVIIGYNTIRSDELGRYQAWEASPFEAAVVAVDSLSLTNPLWVPLYQMINVAPGPNTFMTVDVPIVESAVIEGRVLSVDGAAPVGHIPLLLINRQTGDETRIVTFSDGEFYHMGVRPGEYEIRVDEFRLQGLEAVGPVVRFTVEPLPGGTTVADIELQVQVAGASSP